MADVADSAHGRSFLLNSKRKALVEAKSKTVSTNARGLIMTVNGQDQAAVVPSDSSWRWRCGRQSKNRGYDIPEERHRGLEISSLGIGIIRKAAPKIKFGFVRLVCRGFPVKKHKIDFHGDASV